MMLTTPPHGSLFKPPATHKRAYFAYFAYLHTYNATTDRQIGGGLAAALF
jgi:hypothetical protein